MLTITPALDRATVAGYCKKCRKVYSAAFYAYVAKNGDETLAAALFEMGGDRVTAAYYESAEDDFTLFDGVLRAGLNYAAEQGVGTGVLPEPFRYEHRGSFSHLNYPPQTSFNIVNFFQKYKNCRE